MRSAKPALGVSSTLSDKSERTEAVRYSPDRPILWVGWDMVYSFGTIPAVVIGIALCVAADPRPNVSKSNLCVKGV